MSDGLSLSFPSKLALGVPFPTITVRTHWIPRGADEDTAALFQVETYVFPFVGVTPLSAWVAVLLNEIPPA